MGVKFTSLFIPDKAQLPPPNIYEKSRGLKYRLSRVYGDIFI
jgi:hypothetical protein